MTFQKKSTQKHKADQNYGGIFVLAPPDQGNPAHGGFLPATYCSLVNAKFTYLLHFDAAGTCALASKLDAAVPGTSGAQLAKRYDDGILCKKPLRALKIYSTGLTSVTAKRLHVELWRGGV